MKEPSITSFEVNYLDICDSNHISINLEIDTCSGALSSPIWNAGLENNVLFENSTSFEVIFDNYGNNSVQYIVDNYCGIADSTYTHITSPPVPESFGPDMIFCVQSDYTLELDNDSLNGSWSLNGNNLPTDSIGT